MSAVACANQNGIEALYRDQHPNMVRLALRHTGNRAVAEELVQDAFSRLVPHFDTLETPAAYLRTTVLNACRSWYRNELRLRSQLQKLASVRPTAAAVDGSLDDIVEQLPPAQRLAVRLRYFEDKSELETARTTGWSRGTVKSNTFKGLKRMRRLLENETSVVDGVGA